MPQKQKRGKSRKEKTKKEEIFEEESGDEIDERLKEIDIDTSEADQKAERLHDKYRPQQGQ